MGHGSVDWFKHSKSFLLLLVRHLLLLAMHLFLVASCFMFYDVLSDSDSTEYSASCVVFHS